MIIQFIKMVAGRHKGQHKQKGERRSEINKRDNERKSIFSFLRRANSGNSIIGMNVTCRKQCWSQGGFRFFWRHKRQMRKSQKRYFEANGKHWKQSTQCCYSNVTALFDICPAATSAIAWRLLGNPLRQMADGKNCYCAKCNNNHSFPFPFQAKWGILFLSIKHTHTHESGRARVIPSCETHAPSEWVMI